ncbi:hypothetical protein COV18_05875 [Candidatus Woesearchaeota archaeon CG10_big_fil_rev_8_21_14_0_10_37_12]|nr:MAG: hypothetical protein COV18_05875 [Candidatus Woesearchaeota archaeon CG10_big_fil_rev_8_21_14_0_10_37_12]
MKKGNTKVGLTLLAAVALTALAGLVFTFTGVNGVQGAVSIQPSTAPLNAPYYDAGNTAIVPQREPPLYLILAPRDMPMLEAKRLCQQQIAVQGTSRYGQLEGQTSCFATEARLIEQLKNTPGNELDRTLLREGNYWRVMSCFAQGTITKEHIFQQTGWSGVLGIPVCKLEPYVFAQ